MSADLEPYRAPATPALRAGALDYPTMLQLGAAFAASGLFPGVKDQGVAVIKILAGAEMGLEPVAAMNCIDIIATPNRPPRMRPNTDAQALLAARAGYTYKPVEHTEQKCILEWSHDGKVLGTSEFTIAQAQKARLVRDGGAWQAWPMNMTLARAITQGIKLYCRHVLAGTIGGMAVVTTEELEQEYPDPRDDLMRALFATYREKFPKPAEMDATNYRLERLGWSTAILDRDVPSWNGPEAPETLTRADVQILLDELARLQAAPDPGPAAPVSPANPSAASGADHTQWETGVSAASVEGSAGEQPGPPKAPGRSTPQAPPAEHHYDPIPAGKRKEWASQLMARLSLPEYRETVKRCQAAHRSDPMPCEWHIQETEQLRQDVRQGHKTEGAEQQIVEAPSPAEHHTAEVSREVAPADGTVPAGESRSDTGLPPGAAPTKPAPTRKRQVDLADEARKAAVVRNAGRQEIYRPPTNWLHTLPIPERQMVLSHCYSNARAGGEWLREFATQEGLTPLDKWGETEEWPEDKLALLRATIEAERGAQ